jgi:hypothetical protein
MASRDFRRPGWGSDSIFATNRWFAPPANFQCPFGTTRSQKHPFTRENDSVQFESSLLQRWNVGLLFSTNSRDEMCSSRFEVEDFAKRIRHERGERREGQFGGANDTISFAAR